jgi:hypothetical protein
MRARNAPAPDTNRNLNSNNNQRRVFMNEFQGYQAGMGIGGQLAPQGFFGGLIGAPLGGLIGKGVGSLFGRPELGSQIGNIAGGIGGSLLPFGADPISAAYQQQAIQQQLQQQQLGQLNPQGWLGNLIGSVAQPVGSAIGGLFGRPDVGGTIGGVAGQLGRMLPFGADPVSAAYQQQMGQMTPQGWFGNLIGSVAQPVGSAIGGLFGRPDVGGTIGGVAGQLGRMLPFGADPLTMQAVSQIPPQALIQQIQQLHQQLQQHQQQYAQLLQHVQQQQQQQLAQQGQMTPQGWFGNLIGSVAQPVGSAIGGLFGRPDVGGTIGGVAGQLGRMLPFGADPLTQAYLQQAQLQQAQLAQQQAQLGQGNGYFPAQGMQYTQQPTLH